MGGVSNRKMSGASKAPLTRGVVRVATSVASVLMTVVRSNRNAQDERADPLPRVVGAVEEVVGETGVAGDAGGVQRVAEGRRRPVVPRVVDLLHRRVGFAGQRPPERSRLELVGGPIVAAAEERGEGADQ